MVTKKNAFIDGAKVKKAQAVKSGLSSWTTGTILSAEAGGARVQLGEGEGASEAFGPTDGGDTYVGAQVQVQIGADGKVQQIVTPSRLPGTNQPIIPTGISGLLREKMEGTQAVLDAAQTKLTEDQEKLAVKVETAESNASDAVKSASEAKTTLTGLNARITSDIEPITRSNGEPLEAADEWFKTNTEGQIVDVLIWNNTEWLPYKLVLSSLAVAGSVGNVLIEDGAIDARVITASEELWAKIAVFAEVTTDMLIAGNATITNELIVDTITGKTIIGAKIIGGEIRMESTVGTSGDVTNYSEPFETESTWRGVWMYYPVTNGTPVTNNLTISTVAHTGTSSATSIIKNGRAGATGLVGTFYSDARKVGTAMAFVGEKRVSVWVRVNQAATTGKIFAELVDEEGKTSSLKAQPVTTFVANEWREVTAVIPDGFKLGAFFGVTLSTTSSQYPSAYQVWIDDVKITATQVPESAVNIYRDEAGQPVIDIEAENQVKARLAYTKNGEAGLSLYTAEGGKVEVSSLGVVELKNDADIITFSTTLLKSLKSGETTWEKIITAANRAPYVAPVTPIAQLATTSGSTSIPSNVWHPVTVYYSEPLGAPVGGITQKNGVFTVSQPGIYEATSQAQFPKNGTGRRGLAYIKNGENVAPEILINSLGATYSTQMSGPTVQFKLAAGDTLQMRAIQESGAAMDMANYYFMVKKIG